MTNNMGFTRILCFFCFLMVSTISLSAQSGVVFRYGISTTSFKDVKGDSHFGSQLGVDVMIEDYTFYMLPGIHYYRLNLIDGQGGGIYNKTDDKYLDGLKFKLLLGKRIGQKDSKLQAKVYGGSTIIYANQVSDGIVDSINIDEFKPIVFTGSIGATLIYDFLSIDLNYERGFSNLIKDRADSNPSNWVLSFGIFL